MIDRLKKSQFDLVFAMGTWAGQDLANNMHSVPIMVLSTSDPIGAGIIKSVDNSGLDHVTARVDPDRYLRQIRMFHRICQFNTLGVAYENTPVGRIYSAIDDLKEVSKKRGFKLITCEVVDSTPDTQKADQTCLDCFRKLSNQADAIYVTALTCVDRITDEIVEIFKTAKKPSFSMIGSKYVKNGILLSISSDSGYKELGVYNAQKLAKILNGTKPNLLNQRFEDPLNIAVNIKIARQIGFSVPKSIISIAAEIYDQ
ncbi:MAG: ABC transporter periplasmic protein [Candidatus Magnetoglobus multicellularis str. Araruama]|uniref:ABC transporter periplasmic protein n=1 Tax=Candidatus Magnetoglobus multicellularis str. Araruama TaxID=890399 RepID=A0A1V1PDU3_9BACT|nr:MAG: ABC transporter periplasmic protein [Candidatus Magnetoglobus multicellularis str. Araruama]